MPNSDRDRRCNVDRGSIRRPVMAFTLRSSIRSWFPISATADGKRLVVTRALRGFADGAVSVLLPSYLSALGLGATQIGIIVFGTLLGSALVTDRKSTRLNSSHT